MNQRQQTQWNQINLQQLLAQLQHQQQQQITGDTVTTGLQYNVNTVNNILMNNQVTQPLTTVWLQSNITEQGHQKTIGSTYPAPSAKLDKRQQQIQQLRQQQLQIDAIKKQQQAMTQKVVSNQPITRVMQSNVFQITSTQISFVQPQLIPISPTNEVSKTLTLNQQSVSQMTGQEISAAGLLKLMSAQHHAVHRNPQGNTHDTYQSRTVLNVTHNTASKCTAPVAHAAVQTSVDNKSFPVNTNPSTVLRVAAVLEECAARQTVEHQQLSHHSRYFGHNPHLELPPNKCLLGCVFLIVEYDKYPDTIDDVPTWKRIIMRHGGEVESSYTSRLTHVLCQTQKHPLVQLGLQEGKRCITAYWLSDIIIKRKLIPPWYALHFPTPYSEEKPCSQMLISLTNFEGEERNRVKFMIELAGAQVTSYFSAGNDILVAKLYEGKKVIKARDINRPIVNVQWLNDVLFGNLSCLHQPENFKYQQFNLKDPFRVDFNQLLHLMRAWKVPINLDEELYDQVHYNPMPTKIKQPKTKFPDFIDQKNTDSSMADVIITNFNLPPKEYRPCVMLSRFGLGKEEERLVLQLGGTIAKHYSEATHLVMKEPVRTTKFLCCISTVKYIVNADWLKDSTTEHMFLGETKYAIEEVSVDQNVICKVRNVLSNPNRQTLFKGKIFYVTPGVTHPSVFIVQQIIESAGGTVEKQRRSLRAIKEFEPNTYIVITSNNDLHLVDYLIRASYGIYSSEFVLSAVMTQHINYDMTQTVN